MKFLSLFIRVNRINYKIVMVYLNNSNAKSIDDQPVESYFRMYGLAAGNFEIRLTSA